MATAVLRKPTAERREEIGEAALRILGGRGARALTTANLAEEVGFTTGALFRHFASLEDVLREAVRLGIRKMERTFPEDPLPPLDRALALARRRVELLLCNPGLSWLFRSDEALQALPPDAARALREFVFRSRAFLLKAIREGAREGSIREDIEPEVLFVCVTGAIHALVGMPGVHRLARGSRPVPLETAFNGLRRLLAPGRHAGRAAPRASKRRNE